MNSSRISFGDKVRIRSEKATESKGVAGKTGIVIALRTGGKTIAKGIEFQLSGLQTSDLGQARRITEDKSHTCIATLESRDPLQRMPMSLVAAAGVPPEFDS